MPVTKPQAQMLATLAVACRPHGAPQWDAPGVVAAIGKVKHLSLPDVALAVFRAAGDRDARTPGVITATSSHHWAERTPGAKPTVKVASHERCGICSEARDACRAMWVGDHDFEPDVKRTRDIDTARTVEALRAEVRPTTTTAPTSERPAESNPNVQALRDALPQNFEESA